MIISLNEKNFQWIYFWPEIIVFRALSSLWLISLSERNNSVSEMVSEQNVFKVAGVVLIITKRSWKPLQHKENRQIWTEDIIRAHNLYLCQSHMCLFPHHSCVTFVNAYLSINSSLNLVGLLLQSSTTYVVASVWQECDEEIALF